MFGQTNGMTMDGWADNFKKNILSSGLACYSTHFLVYIVLSNGAGEKMDSTFTATSSDMNVTACDYKT